MRRKRVLLEAWRGRRTDDPLAISERLAVERPDLKLTWVTNSKAVRGGQVRRNGVHYFLELATADYYVTNDMSPRYPGHHRSIRYLQTWHGTPLKRIGFDSWYRGRKSRYLDRLKADVRRWSCLVSASPEVTEILRQAFGYGGEVIETGYPRNDILVTGNTAQGRRAARERVGVPLGATCVLHMPTWRDAARDAQGRPSWISGYDPIPWLEQLPEEYFVLSRLHPVIRGRSGVQGGGRVKDVTEYPNVADLYLCADALVTDYSSAMFDFAVTGRPIVFYVWDYEEYTRSVRGTYFDLQEIAPGPMVEAPGQLAAALGDMPRLDEVHRRSYEAFRRRFLPHEDGGATERVIERVFA